MEQNLTKPDNYLAWAIFSTFLCCTPLGIIAIVKATEVDTQWAQGHYDSAYQAAASAKKWTLFAVIVGLCGGFLFSLLFL